jgi:hypothetical protein
MIRVDILKSKGNIVWRKNGTFLEGGLYFGRMSKDGNSYVIKGEEDYWIPVEHRTWAKRTDVQKYFTTHSWFLVDNYKDLNNIASPELLLSDFYKCEQCGYNVPYCNDCV